MFANEQLQLATCSLLQVLPSCRCRHTLSSSESIQPHLGAFQNPLENVQFTEIFSPSTSLYFTIHSVSIFTLLRTPAISTSSDFHSILTFNCTAFSSHVYETFLCQLQATPSSGNATLMAYVSTAVNKCVELPPKLQSLEHFCGLHCGANRCR